MCLRLIVNSGHDRSLKYGAGAHDIQVVPDEAAIIGCRRVHVLLAP